MIQTNLQSVMQVGIDQLVVSPDITTGVALLIGFAIFVPFLGAIYLRSALTMVPIVLQFTSLVGAILLGFNLSIFWTVSLISMIVLGMSMAIFVAYGDVV